MLDLFVESMYGTPILVLVLFNVIKVVFIRPFSKTWKEDIFKLGDYNMYLIISLLYFRLKAIPVILRVVVDLNKVLYILSLIVGIRVVVVVTVYLNKQSL